MKQIVIAGKSDAIISLNKVGVPLRGKNPTVINMDTPEKEAEINGLISIGLIEIVKDTTKEEITQEAIDESIRIVKGKGRPKGSKNRKVKTESERVDEAEARTQKMGSRVVISTGRGNKEANMKHSTVDDEPPTSQTQASIDAMKQLDAQENAPKEKPIDESKLEPSEQNGRKATVSIEGETKSVNMVNNTTPGSKDIKEADPFIDKKDDNYDDAFIKI